MDIPDLVRERLGDEEITAGVSIGDEDAVCLTPTRTLIYRSEGLLSDQRVEEYSHDAERIAVKEGRRKTKFLLEYVEGTESFTVPANRGEKVLELLLEGVLRVDGVIREREAIAGVYRFTELTLIVAEGRLLKHIGSHVWDDDFEAYPFEDVTGLEFERASNATSITVSVGGRPQRVKVPNDTARVVQQTIEDVLFDYYDVTSLDELNSIVGRDESEDVVDDVPDRSDDIGFEAGIDPLVTDTEDEADEEKLERQLEDAASEESGARPERMDVSIGERDASGDGVTDAGAANASTTPTTDETHTSETADDAATSETRADDQGPGAEEWSSQGTTESASTVESEDAAGAPAESGVDDGPAESATTTDRPSSNQRVAESTRTVEESAGTKTRTEPAGASGSETAATSGDGTSGAASEAELEALTERVDQLTDAVERQNELLKRQHKAIKQLAREVRSE